MSSFTAIKHTNDWQRDEILPFNPVADGWKYTGSNCCDIGFQKGKFRLKFNTEHGEMRVVKGINNIHVWRIPKDQLEFLIKAHGINDN